MNSVFPSLDFGRSFEFKMPCVRISHKAMKQKLKKTTKRKLGFRPIKSVIVRNGLKILKP